MLSISIAKYKSELLNVELEIFKDDSGTHWFHGATLCDIFNLPNPAQVIQRHIDEDWRKKFPVTRGKEAWYIMEPGFYQLLHASNHPAAKRFQRWVYSDVLPSIRNQGGYIAPDATPEQVQCIYDSYQTQIAAARETVKNIPISDPKIGTVARNIKHLERLAREEEMIKTFGRVVPYRNK